MESMQSVLPSSVSPGWNDPPNLGGTTPTTPINRLSNLRKRLVDPSITGGSSPFAAASPLAGSAQIPHEQAIYGAGNVSHNPNQMVAPVGENLATSPYGGSTAPQVQQGVVIGHSGSQQHHPFDQPVHHEQQWQGNYQNPAQHTTTFPNSPQFSSQNVQYPAASGPVTTSPNSAFQPVTAGGQMPYQGPAASTIEPSMHYQMAGGAQFFQQQALHEAPPIRRA